MAIDFDLTTRQRRLKYEVREFAREIVRPAAEYADRLVDPQQAFCAMKPAFEQAQRMGLTTGFLPAKYGGGGQSNVDLLIATEELAAGDAGFATTILINGLALLPLAWFGTEQLCERWIGTATAVGHEDFLAGWVVSERGGTANFDHPSPRAGIQLLAEHDPGAGEYIINGEKHWSGNAGGWDLQGADVNICVVRTDRRKGGKEGLAVIAVARGVAGIEYRVVDKLGHRTCQNVTMTFHDVRVPEENLFAKGDGDFVINRAFTWSGPVAAIAALGVARAAYEFTLKWSRSYTGGGSTPIIDHQAVGHLVADVAARIEAARSMCWRTAHYLDKHGDAGHALGAMNKVYCTELMQQVVGDCMRVVGVNALDKRFGLEKMYRDAVGFPLYDGGNVGMQRRRAWGVIADPAFTADLIVDGEFIEFTKSMEGYGAAPDTA